MMPNKQLADLVAFVRPLQGTDSHFAFSYGNCLPLVSRPFGMTNWCPQTDEGGWLFGYRAPKLQGIRATHQPSPWIGDYGHFAIMPQVGALLLDAGKRSSLVRRQDLEIGPDYFKALFWRYRTMVELTPTERCAALRFTFPATERARIMFHTFEGAASVALDVERRILSGYTRANSGCAMVAGSIRSTSSPGIGAHISKARPGSTAGPRRTVRPA